MPTNTFRSLVLGWHGPPRNWGWSPLLCTTWTVGALRQKSIHQAARTPHISHLKYPATHSLPELNKKIEALTQLITQTGHTSARPNNRWTRGECLILFYFTFTFFFTVVLLFISVFFIVYYLTYVTLGTMCPLSVGESRNYRQLLLNVCCHTSLALPTSHITRTLLSLAPPLHTTSIILKVTWMWYFKNHIVNSTIL